MRRCVADSVVEERAKDLSQPIPIGVGDQSGCDVAVETDAGGIRTCPECLHRLCHQLVDRDRLETERQIASLRTADGAQVVDDPGQQARLVTDRLQVLVLMGVHALENGRGRRFDHGERRLELVDRVLEEPQSRCLGMFERVGHRIE